MTEVNEIEHARFIAFYDETKARLYGWLLARCGKVDLAQDLLSDAYLGTLKAFAASDDEHPSSTLLFTIANRRLIDHWRRQKSSEEKLYLISQQRPAPPAPDASDEHILKALGSLPDRQRAAVAMRYVDGFGVDEIAERLDVSYKSAESLLSRGRATLRRSYEEEVGHVN